MLHIVAVLLGVIVWNWISAHVSLATNNHTIAPYVPWRY
jgi:hypothetical protein